MHDHNTQPDHGSHRRWAVLGGGMMGMALADRLADHGQDVTLLEASPSLGGLADAWQLGDVTWDRHYHVTLLSDSCLRHLLNELNLEDDLRWVETKTGFFSNGQFYSMSNTREFLQFPPLTLIEKLRLGGTIFLASKIRNWRRLESIPVETWLRRWSGDSTFEKIWLPLLKAKLGSAYRRVSAAFIWAYISRMYKARRTGLKKEMFGYVPGGYSRILEAFQARLRQQEVTICLNAKVTEVAAAGSNQVRLRLDDGNSELYDRAVLTIPSNIVSKICRTMQEEELAQHRSIEYLGIVCASVLLKKPLRGYYVTNITDDVPFTAVIETTAMVSPEEFKGQTLVYLPKYATQDDPVFERSDDQIRTEFLTTLLKMYPELTESDVVAFRVSRVRSVMALPTLDYSAKLPPIGSSIENVYVVNSAHIVKGTLNVNETLDLAYSAFNTWLRPKTD